MTAAVLSLVTFINISAAFLVRHELVSFATGADGAVPRVLTLVITAAIADGAEIHHLHFDSVARAPVHPELKPWGASTDEGPFGVDAGLQAAAILLVTLVDIFTRASVRCERETRETLTHGPAPVIHTLVFAAGVTIAARVGLLTCLSVICQGESTTTAAVVVPIVALSTDVFASSVVHAASRYRYARASVCVQPLPLRALAVKAPVRVDALVLAAAIVVHTLVYINARFHVLREFESCVTATLVGAYGVLTIQLTATVVVGTLVYIILALGSLIASWTSAVWVITSPALAAIVTHCVVALPV